MASKDLSGLKNRRRQRCVCAGVIATGRSEWPSKERTNGDWFWNSEEKIQADLGACPRRDTFFPALSTLLFYRQRIGRTSHLDTTKVAQAERDIAGWHKGL